MEDIKFIVTEVFEFENRKQSENSAFLESSDYQNCEDWNKINEFLIEHCKKIIQLPIEILVGGFKLAISGKDEFDFWKKISYKHFIDFVDYQVSVPVIKLNDLHTESFLPSVLFSFDIMMKKILPVISRSPSLNFEVNH